MKWLPSLRRETSDSEAPSAAADPGDAPTGSSSLSTLVDAPSVSPFALSAPQAPAAGDGGSGGPSVPVDGTPAAFPAEGQLLPEAARETTAGADSTAPLADALEKLREELLHKQQALNDEQRALNELFTTRLRSDEAQGRAVEKLHDELRQYKTNFVRQQLLPVLKEVIFCHDFIVAHSEKGHSEKGHDKKDDSETPAAAVADRPEASVLDATRQMLVDLLFKYDVEPYRSEGELFDPKMQQCTNTVPNHRSEADKTIAARGLPGFRGPEGIVRREQVSVYKFTPGAD